MGIQRTRQPGGGNQQPQTQSRFRDTVEYAGEFRIIGTVWRDARTLLGYVILHIPTLKPALRPIEMVKKMLQASRFENAELTNGEIVNTECSMDRLFKYNSKMALVENRGIHILAEIHVNGKTMGYRVLSSDGKCSDLTEKALLDLVDIEGDPKVLVNAKVVTTDSGRHISAIKKPFKVINREVLTENAPAKTVVASASKAHHRRYLSKATETYFRQFCFKGQINDGYLMTMKACKRMVRFLREVVAHNTTPFQALTDTVEILGRYTSHLNNNKPSITELRMAVATGQDIINTFLLIHFWLRSRFVPSVYGEIPVASFTELKRFTVWKVARVRGNEYTSSIIKLPNKQLVMQIIHNFRYELYEGTFRANLLTDIPRFYEEVHFLQTAKANKLGWYYSRVPSSRLETASPTLKPLLKLLYHQGGRSEERIRSWENREAGSFRTLDLDYFTDVGLEHFGLTIYRDRVGEKVDSVVYGKITLKYYLEAVEQYAPHLAAQAEELVQCFGDLRLLYYLLRERNNIHRARNTKVYKGYLVDFALLALHNPNLARAIAPVLPNEIVSTVDIDTLAMYGEGLSTEDKLFYYSGGFFNRDMVIVRNMRWGAYRLTRESLPIDLLAFPESTLMVLQAGVREEISSKDRYRVFIPHITNASFSR